MWRLITRYQLKIWESNHQLKIMLSSMRPALTYSFCLRSPKKTSTSHSTMKWRSMWLLLHSIIYGMTLIRLTTLTKIPLESDPVTYLISSEPIQLLGCIKSWLLLDHTPYVWMIFPKLLYWIHRLLHKDAQSTSKPKSAVAKLKMAHHVSLIESR